MLEDFRADAADKLTLAETEKLIGMMDEAIIKGEVSQNAEKGKSGTKYLFKGYAEDGKGIYESNFPLGTPKKAKGERILKYIQNVWSKKPIKLKTNDNGIVRTIEAQFDPTYDENAGTVSDASKLMGGNRHGTSSEQRVTLDLADDYYQIASESSYNYSKDEEGKATDTHKDVSRWHYFINDIYFAENGSDKLTPYRVTINIKEKSDGHFVYSFSAEKAGEISTQRTLHAAVSGSDKTTTNGDLSNKSIPQTSQKSTPSTKKSYNLSPEAESRAAQDAAEVEAFLYARDTGAAIRSHLAEMQDREDHVRQKLREAYDYRKEALKKERVYRY